MKAVSGVGAAVLALAVGGCATVNTASFAEMSRSYQAAIESYQNDNLLLNIVRSAQQRPLSFLEIPSVVGSGTVTGGGNVSATVMAANPGSLTGFFSAAAGSSSGAGGNLSVSKSFNFTQSSLNNAAFLKAFVTPLTPETVDYFNRDTVPRELLFALVIDSIQVRDGEGRERRYVNNPLNPDYPAFRAALRQLIDDGLTTQAVSVDVPLGPVLTASQAAGGINAFLGLREQQRLALREVPGSKGEAFQMYQTARATWLCLGAPGAARYAAALRCDRAWTASGAPSVEGGIAERFNEPPRAGQIDVAVRWRSSRDVFDFLGAVVAAAERQAPAGGGPAILVVRRGAAAERALASVDYEGERYRVPAQDNGHSTLTLNLLAQLLTLNKIPGAVPASPAVLIR